MPSCDLAKLAAAGRAKNSKEPWSEVELNALYELKIPVDYVRKGVVTMEEFEKVKAEVDASLEKGDKPLFFCSRDELCQIAGVVGATFRDGMSDASLISSIKYAMDNAKDEVIKEDEALEVNDKVCIECGFEAKNANGLRLHMKKHMPEVVMPEVPVETPEVSLEDDSLEEVE
jgi:hypothetical protein